MVEEQSNQPERERQKKDVEHGLLKQPIKENRRCVDRETDPGNQSDFWRKESLTAKCEQGARHRPDCGLNDPHREQVVAKQSVNDAEEIGIQRRLVEHVSA